VTDLSYRTAGVDREVAASAKRRILELVAATAGPNVIPNPGGFGGLFRVPSGMRDPVLVSSADSVGTKLKVAVLAGRHHGVGTDIVHHCANDILVEGARPLFFLDYIGMGRLEPGTVEQVVEGIAQACRENGCALLGGETAEMPDVYASGEYDLTGFIVGVVENEMRPGRQRVGAGDRLIALASDGFHTNGYSLLRHLLFQQLGLRVADRYPGLDRTVADVLLQPHRSYVKAILPLIDDGLVNALAHITGGGIPENLDRALPDGYRAIVERSSWTPPPAFHAVMEHGAITEEEMFLTFNMGVGLVLVVGEHVAGVVMDRLRSAGERAWLLGHVERGPHGVRLV